MFAAVPPEQWTVKVAGGLGGSRSGCPTPVEVLALLHDLQAEAS